MWTRYGEILPDPEQIGLAPSLPFVRVITGCAAFLAALYLLIGVDPSGPVGNLVVDYIDLTLPMAGRVAGFWVFYSIFYLCLGSLDRDLRVASLVVNGLARFWARRSFRPWFGSAVVLLGKAPPLRCASVNGAFLHGLPLVGALGIQCSWNKSVVHLLRY